MNLLILTRSITVLINLKMKYHHCTNAPTTYLQTRVTSDDDIDAAPMHKPRNDDPDRDVHKYPQQHPSIVLWLGVRAGGAVEPRLVAP